MWHPLTSNIRGFPQYFSPMLQGHQVGVKLASAAQIMVGA